VRGREGVLLAIVAQLSFIHLAPDLGALFQVRVRRGDIRDRRRIGGRGYLIRVVGVDARLDALFLSETGELVIVQTRGGAAVLPAVAVKPLSWRIWDLLCHGASKMEEKGACRPVHGSDATWHVRAGVGGIGVGELSQSEQAAG
jgi:hypothetical protein